MHANDFKKVEQPPPGFDTTRTISPGCMLPLKSWSKMREACGGGRTYWRGLNAFKRSRKANGTVGLS